MCQIVRIWVSVRGEQISERRRTLRETTFWNLPKMEIQTLDHFDSSRPLGVVHHLTNPYRKLINNMLLKTTLEKTTPIHT